MPEKIKKVFKNQPYKQRVGGSNPSTPTSKKALTDMLRLFCLLGFLL